MLRALARTEADRPASARQFAEELAAPSTEELPGTSAARPGTAPRRRTIVIAATIAVLLLAGWLAVTWHGRAAPPTASVGAPAAVAPAADSMSLAVLYLENLSPDTLDAYIADGLTEEITTRLARIGRLRVKSPEAVRRARGADPARAGRDLGVAHVVAGSIRRVGDSLRVAVRLIDSAGFQTWNREFDVSRRNLLALQDSIARQVAVAIGGRLTTDEHAALVAQATNDPDAYDHYLRGNFQLAKRSPQAVERAIGEYAAALATDPRFAAARARQAYAYALFVDWGWPYPSLTPDQLLARGLEAADRAIRQDSGTADGWMARAYLMALQHPRTMEGAPAAFQRAIALDSSNPEVYYQLGQTWMATGHAAEAQAAYQHAIRLDPRWAAALMSSGGLSMFLRRPEEALGWLDSAVAVDSTSSYSYAVRAVVRAGMGRTAEARADAQRALAVSSGYRIPAYSVLAVTAAQAGDTAAARSWLGQALRDLDGQPSSTDANFIGGALVAVGDRAGALDLLERVQPRTAWLWFYFQKPEFDPIRRDPRFGRVMAAARPPNAPLSPAER